MIKTLNPHSTEKTAEIMSRYRPIAPKPESSSSPSNDSALGSNKIRQSPYLRNLWPQMQARPTRTRKRCRVPISPPALKRQRTYAFGVSVSPTPCNVQFHPAFSCGLPQLAPAQNKPINTRLMTLPLLPCPLQQTAIVANNQALVPKPNWMKPSGEEKLLDLNSAIQIPEEKDHMQQLPATPKSTVISPRPLRPVGSSICVRSIREDPKLAMAIHFPKKPEEVEEEIESEMLPAVISDSNNKVRIANSAYKEMVGQPECSWLDSMVTADGRVGGSRIGGEVILRLCDSTVPFSSNGFSCWVRIEWGSEGNKNWVNAFCDAIRISCESKDYAFTWRFHTQTKELVSQSSCNV
ncbi:hypothetical protein UlMin_035396 [Ulmus minor]